MEQPMWFTKKKKQQIPAADHTQYQMGQSSFRLGEQATRRSPANGQDACTSEKGKRHATILFGKI